MARQLSEVQAPPDVLAALTGPPKPSNVKVRRGAQALDEARSFNMMAIGDWGSGKTNIIKGMLEAGLKVLAADVDFGGSTKGGGGGLNTIYNHLRELRKTEPARADELAERLVAISLGYDDFAKFLHAPATVVPDIYEWDPDVLFLDGFSAYQLAELEGKINDDDPLREGVGAGDWRKALNGTLFPLMRFLQLQNPHNSKPWHHAVTCLEEEKSQFKKTGKTLKGGYEGRELIEGSAKYGPMLHTTARAIVGAGFDIVMRTKLDSFGVHKYQFDSPDAQLKQRNYGLPKGDWPSGKFEADFAQLWREFIEPLHSEMIKEIK